MDFLLSHSHRFIILLLMFINYTTDLYNSKTHRHTHAHTQCELADYDVGRAMRKPVFGHMRYVRTAKAQISLCIRAVLSGSLLSAARLIGYYRMYKWRAKAQMRPYANTGWCESAHFANARRQFWAWRDPYHVHIPDQGWIFFCKFLHADTYWQDLTNDIDFIKRLSETCPSVISLWKSL